MKHITRRMMIGLLAAAVLLAAGATWVLAQTTDGPIYACVLKDGTLRIVKDANQCKKGETLLTWSIQGPPGAPGPAGPAGPVANRQLVPAANSLTTLDSTGYTGIHPSMTIGADGLPIISYLEMGDSPVSHLKVAHCNDVACTAAKITSLGAGWGPSITIGADGLPVISYWDYANYDLKVAHCNDTACTTATFATLDSAGDVGEHNSITIGVDGNPVISYYDNTNDDLKVAHCNDAACTTAALVTLDSDGDVGDENLITLGADGLPIISYVDLTNHDLKVAHCNDAACTSAALATLDSAAYVQTQPSITIGADGLPIISYLDLTGDVLKVAHCNDTACGSAALSIVDSLPYVDSDNDFSSITIGADGLPIISYVGNDGQDHLYVAHCNDVACTGAVRSMVDSVVPDQPTIAITIGADGLPIIAYCADMDTDLRVAHCSNAFCTPYVRRR